MLRMVPPPSQATGEDCVSSSPAKRGRGTADRRWRGRGPSAVPGLAPSTMLRMVPLPVARDRGGSRPRPDCGPAAAMLSLGGIRTRAKKPGAPQEETYGFVHEARLHRVERRRRVRRRPHGPAGLGAGELPGAADPDDLPVGRGRRHRCDGAHRRARSSRRIRPAGQRRQPHRRLGVVGHSAIATARARRLHARHHHGRDLA